MDPLAGSVRAFLLFIIKPFPFGVNHFSVQKRQQIKIRNFCLSIPAGLCYNIRKIASLCLRRAEVRDPKKGGCFLKRGFCIFICLLLLCGQLCFAAEEPETAEALLAEFMTEWDLDASNFAFAYFNTVTGEEAAFNSAAFLPAGAVWTLPLHMYYYEQEALGAFEPNLSNSYQEFTVDGLTLEDCRYHSILLADTAVSEKMRAQIGTFRQYQFTVNEGFGHIDEAALPDSFFTDTCYSAEFLMNCLKDITARQEVYRDLMQNFSLAQKRDGLAGYDGTYSLTHIRGEQDGMICDIAQVSAPQPYLVVCFADAADGDALLAALNTRLCAYAEAAVGSTASEEVVPSAADRSDSDFTVAGTRPNDRGRLYLWIGIVLAVAVGLAAICGGIIRKRRHSRED